MSETTINESPSLIGSTHLRGVILSDGWELCQEYVESVEPATGKSLGKVALAGPEAISAATCRAKLAQPRWAAVGPEQRSAVLVRSAALVEIHRKEILEWLIRESGSSRAKAEFEVKLSLQAIQLAATMPLQPRGVVLPSTPGRMSFATRRPRGVVGVIAPFNFPLYLAMRAAAPALAVGNAVVLKPDPRTAICGGIVIARIFELAGIPPGVFHLIPGGAAAGETLCGDPNVAMIQFTGSTTAGRVVGQTASAHLKKVSLELGGKNAIIVLEDADLDLAVRNVAWAVFLHQGQICMSGGRILVHDSILPAFLSRLSKKATSLRMGDPLDPGNVIGPLINQRQYDHVLRVVNDAIAAGAVLETGGPGPGLFFKPTVLRNVTRDMTAFNEEIFGPVAIVSSFSTDDEAVAIANDTSYGLSAALITKDIARAMSIGAQLRTGVLHINDQTINDDVVNPFGGTGASGNGAAIGGPANWEEFTEWHWTTVRETPPAYPI